jgi:hypothetical protein
MDDNTTLVLIIGIILLFILSIALIAVYSHFSPPQYVTIPVHS